MKHRIVKTEENCYTLQEEYLGWGKNYKWRTIGKYSSFVTAEFMAERAYANWLERLPRTIATYTDGVLDET